MERNRMIPEEMWQEIKRLSASGLFRLLKDLIRESKEHNKYDSLRGLFCIMAELLAITREIESLEKERAFVNRRLHEGKDGVCEQ